MVFITVVEEGSFAGAARKLGRATSVISYSIANLESQLGVSLFDRDTTKRPQLSPAGRLVLSQARIVADGVSGLRARVKGLHQGIEAEVRLVVDVMLPEERVVDALSTFRAEFPTVALHMRVEGLGAAMQNIVDREASIGVCGPPDVTVDGVERFAIGSVDLIPVAAPGHPLVVARHNPPGASRSQLQIVLTDRSPRTQGADLGVVSMQTWHVADLATKHTLLREGIGWGNMPEPMVRADIEAGRLVRLELPDMAGGPYRFFAAYRTDTPPGPAAAFLLSRFAGQVEPGPGAVRLPILKNGAPESSLATDAFGNEDHA